MFDCDFVIISMQYIFQDWDSANFIEEWRPMETADIGGKETTDSVYIVIWMMGDIL